MSTHIIKVEAGPHDREDTPVSWPCPPDFVLRRSVWLEDLSGETLPVQVTEINGERRFHVLIPAMAAGTDETYALTTDDQGYPELERVQLREVPDGIAVTVDGQPLTTYVATKSGTVRPYCYPLLGPDGVHMTRQFPMRTKVPGETSDHPHHRSLWVAYGEVNETDNWSEQDQHGFTRHDAFEMIQSGPVLGAFTARSTWTTNAGLPLLTERRSMTFYRQPDTNRSIDLSVVLTCGDTPVTFGDTKEGGIVSIRVASSMDGKRGGVIQNAYGGVGEAETWGKRAQWCDYSGEVDGRLVGICVMDHPDNFRAPTYWHVREYGLMTANPFGGETFTGNAALNGRYTLEPAQSLSFRYRIVLRDGDAEEAVVAELYHDYINPPKVSQEREM